MAGRGGTSSSKRILWERPQGLPAGSREDMPQRLGLELAHCIVLCLKPCRPPSAVIDFRVFLAMVNSDAFADFDLDRNISTGSVEGLTPDRGHWCCRNVLDEKT